MKPSCNETCKNGHPLTPANIYVQPKTGYGRCRICRRKDPSEFKRPPKVKVKPVEIREWTPAETEAFETALTRLLVKITAHLDRLEGPLLTGEELQDRISYNHARNITRERSKQRRKEAA